MSLAQRLRPYLPRQFSLSPPVCQLYLNDGQRQTRFTLLQFPSILSPEHTNSYYYEVRAYRDDGTLAGIDRIPVCDKGSVDYPLELAPFASKLSEFGLFTAQLRPRRRIAYKDQHLGKLTSQFYAMYHTPAWQSMALVHPQTTLENNPAPWLRWSSSHLIDVSELTHVEVFQINPSSVRAKSMIFLEDADGQRYLTADDELPPLATRRIDWATQSLPADRLLHLGAEGLTGMNAKPLIFCHFRNGTFSGSHA